jgi:hypothetical protein
MNNEDVTPIILSSNYSGTSEHVALTNEDLLKLTDQQGSVIYGPTLFALKYRVLPCTVNRSLNATLGEYDDAFILSMTGQFSGYGRGRQWNARRKQGGMYHATRLVCSFRAILNSNN